MIDYHVHTHFSDGENSVRQVLTAAVDLGITRLAITDHYDPYDPSLHAMDSSIKALARHFEKIKECAKSLPLTICVGVETSTGPDGRLRLPQEVLDMCSLVITSVHYLDMEIPLERGRYDNDRYWGAYKEKLLAQAAGDGDVLGHPEAYLPIRPMLEESTTFEDRLRICAQISERYFDRPFIDALGDALLRSGKAYELHGASSTPRLWVVKRLNEKGVRFSIGSDAHSLDRLGCNSRAMKLWKELGLSVFLP